MSPKQRALLCRAMEVAGRRAAWFLHRYEGLFDREAVLSSAKLGVARALEGYDEEQDATFEGYVRAHVDGQLRRLVKRRMKDKRIAGAVHVAACMVVAHYRINYSMLERDRAVQAGKLDRFLDDVALGSFVAGIEERLSMSPEDDAADREIDLEAAWLLAEALEDVPKGVVAVLAAVLVEDMQYKEVAERLGMSVRTVRRRMEQAPEMLRLAIRRECLRRRVPVPVLSSEAALVPVLRAILAEYVAGRSPKG